MMKSGANALLTPRSKTINILNTIPKTASQPRTRGTLQLSTKAGPRDASVLDDLYQSGALRAVFPRSKSVLQAVMVNTSGGITGGDRLSLRADVGPDSQLSITTQACERAYRAQPDETGHVDTRLSVADNGVLHWLPQETLLFDHCALARNLRVDLAPTAQALIVEPIVFGRAAMGEVHVSGDVSERIEIFRDGTPLVIDAWHMQGDLSAQMARPAVGNGAMAMASLTYVAPDAIGHIDALRALPTNASPGQLGLSLLADDVLVARFLAPSGFDLRACLIPVLEHLTQDALPTCWRL